VTRGAVAVRLAASLAAAMVGCGDDQPDPAAEAAAGVAAVLRERLGPDAGEIVVTCPEDLPIETVAEFVCDVAVGDAEPVQVDLAVAADGTVRLRRAVVPTAAAEAYLVGELAGPAEGPVEVDCGAAPLLVADVGDPLRCEVVRTADGAVHGVVVTVLALDGTVRYDVEPAGPVAGSADTTTTATTLAP
jgi:hypothetical protein